MAQVPATPKLRRARLRLTARALGPSAVRGPVQVSERAALDMRAARINAPSPVDPDHVVFLIPLVGRHHVSDWDAVLGRLGRTLDSFLAQTDPRWQAVICGQDAPTLPDDDRITFLPFADAIDGNDKWAKLAQLANSLPDHAGRAGYAMSFDADDLLHRDAVAQMLTRRATGGYLVERGYVRDMASGATGLAAPPTIFAPLRKPFWKLCGSCAALRFDLDALPAFPAFLAALTQHEHRMFPYLAALSGAPLTPLAGAAAMYLLNHGDNFGARRGRVGFKTRYVRRFPVDDPGELDAITRDFPDP